MTLSPDLKEFIISFCREFKIRNIDIEALNLETSIDLDLDIFDIDFDYFLNDFGERYKIDITKLKWGDKFQYPSEDDMGIIYCIVRYFNFKKDWVKRMCAKYYTPKMHVKDFQYAIDNGFFETTS
jgi:hypothetical protein